MQSGIFYESSSLADRKEKTSPGPGPRGEWRAIPEKWKRSGRLKRKPRRKSPPKLGNSQTSPKYKKLPGKGE